MNEKPDWRWYVADGEGRGGGLVVRDDEVWLTAGIVDGKDHPGDVNIKLNSRLLKGLAGASRDLAELLDARRGDGDG